MGLKITLTQVKHKNTMSKRHQRYAVLGSQTYIKLRKPRSKGIFKGSLFAFGLGLCLSCDNETSC